MASLSYWYCNNCKEEVSPTRVTHQELHDTCGHPIVWIESIPLKRLLEICNAERDGRCVVLPCKVGDAINAFRFSEEKGLHVVSDKVTKVLQTKKGFTICTKKVFYPIKTDEYDIADIKEYPHALADYYIGTREAAEAALKGAEYG